MNLALWLELRNQPIDRRHIQTQRYIRSDKALIACSWTSKCVKHCRKTHSVSIA